MATRSFLGEKLKRSNKSSWTKKQNKLFLTYLFKI